MSAFTTKVTSTLRTFEGEDLEAWLVHFKLEACRDVIRNALGIRHFTDLAEIYEEPSLIIEARSKMTSIDFKRLMKAPTETAAFAGMAFAAPGALDAFLAPTIPTAVPVSRPVDGCDGDSIFTTLSTTAAASETTEVKQMKKDVLKLEKQKAKLEKEAAATAGTEDLRRQVALLQSDVAGLTMTKDERKTMKTKVKETKRRLIAIAEIASQLSKAASLDLCFCVDCTGSMAGHIKSVTDNILSFVAELGKFYPDIPLRLAFVGYRDHCDKEQRLSVLRFTMEASEFRAFVGSQAAMGGGDAPEDVFGALNVVTDLDWLSAHRILYHIGDAPCHGTRFHTCGGDEYPAGDPHGLLAEKLLPSLADKNVQYFFGRINSSTDTMIRIFNEIAGDKFVKTVDCSEASKMMTGVARTVTDSMSSSVSVSSNTDAVDRPDIILDATEPVFKNIRSEKVNKFEMRGGTIEDILESKNDLLSVQPVPALVDMQVAPLPFAKGACRVAYRSQEATFVGPSKRSSKVNCIHKVFISRDSKKLTRENYEMSSISAHRAATCLADGFNRVKPAGSPSIRFAAVALLQYLERPGQPFATQEPELSGEWEKFNNNAGMVNRTTDTDHAIVQTFSHWTHSRTDKELMVVDCQGVYEEATRTFLLTDPALHCRDVTRFGGTNQGKPGMRRFFKTHTCNAYCRAMRLTVPESYASVADTSIVAG